MITLSEENYLKAIYRLESNVPSGASTSSIANRMNTKASSVTDMVKKLADKGLVNYKKYQLSSPEVLNLLAPNNYTVEAYYLPNEDQTISEVFIYQNDIFFNHNVKIPPKIKKSTNVFIKIKRAVINNSI